MAIALSGDLVVRETLEGAKIASFQMLAKFLGAWIAKEPRIPNENFSAGIHSGDETYPPVQKTYKDSTELAKAVLEKAKASEGDTVPVSILFDCGKSRNVAISLILTKEAGESFDDLPESLGRPGFVKTCSDLPDTNVENPFSSCGRRVFDRDQFAHTLGTLQGSLQRQGLDFAGSTNIKVLETGHFQAKLPGGAVGTNPDSIAGNVFQNIFTMRGLSGDGQDRYTGEIELSIGVGTEPVTEVPLSAVKLKLKIPEGSERKLQVV